MNTYDPHRAPDPDAWLSLDESQRIHLIRRYHQKARVKLPNERLHATFHAIVENQAALGDELPVRATLDRLMDEGLDRHDAVHAIAHWLSEFIMDLHTLADLSEGDVKEQYLSELEAITAADWLASFD